MSEVLKLCLKTDGTQLQVHVGCGCSTATCSADGQIQRYALEIKDFKGHFRANKVRHPELLTILRLTICSSYRFSHSI